MNKFYRIASLVTIGVSSCSQFGVLAAESDAKPLSLSLGLKGFYDDNIFSRPSGPEKADSFGIQLTPSIGYKIKEEATTVSLSYTLDAKWYERRSRDSFGSGGNVVQKSDPWDYAHYIKFLAAHKFSDTFSLEATDSFAITTEPQEFLSGQIARSKSDALINNAGIKSDIGLSELFGLEFAYKNNLYDYSDPGYKAVLNRMENIPSIDLRYKINPTLFGILGYRYKDVAYDKAQTLFVQPNGSPVYSDARDSSSHFVYGGADYQANPTLSFSARVGAEFTDYSNLKKYNLQGSDSSTSPYADFSAKWKFQKDSYVQGGIRHQLNATDALYPTTVSATSSSIILNQESTLLYAVVGHNLTPALRASVSGQYQDSVFKGGTYDGKSESFYGIGLSLSYAINTYLSAEASYFYDKLSAADAVALESRGYSRNRVFLGIRASY